jgi:hypothetical protein
MSDRSNSFAAKRAWDAQTVFHHRRIDSRR